MKQARVSAIATAIVAALTVVWAGSAWAQSNGRASDEGLTRDEVRQHAQKIDQILEAGLRKRGARPNLPLDDGQFLRRIYLNVAGRIPSYEEAVQFLRSSNSIKRAALIDELIDSPAYTSHFYNWWADLLRIRDNLQNGVNGEPYANWVKRAIHENRPYDQMVEELITASGRVDQDGAAGYYVRDSGMPLDHTANTVRVFLGTSLGCAMCHDHPFDKWSQMEFYEMSSFTYGVQTRTRGNQELDKAYRQAQQLAYEEKLDRRVAGYLRQLSRADNYEVHETQRQVRLPHDYKYSDGNPNQVVEPFTIFGSIVEPQEGESWRQAYARWMTSKENPRFAKVIANRLWKRALGRGLIEPVDEITDASEPAYPQLMEYLTQLMKDLDYDMKQFQRVLLYTRAYQRQASREEPTGDEPFDFAGPVLRRMTAEQMWDSLLTLAQGNPDRTLNYESSPADLAAPQYDYARYEGKSAEQILELAKQQVQQMNGSGDGMAMMMGYGGRGNMKVRASEMPQPAPPGHPLRRFGQSDRELINNASTEPSVPQVLYLMNGPIDEGLLRTKTALSENVRTTDGAVDKLAVIWLSILSRYPDRAEQATALQEVQSSGEAGYANLVWALLNSREFMFIR